MAGDMIGVFAWVVAGCWSLSKFEVGAVFQPSRGSSAKMVSQGPLEHRDPAQRIRAIVERRKAWER